MRSILVCAAVEEELGPLLSGMRRDGARWFGEAGGVSLTAVSIGVGPVLAAFGAAAALRGPFDAAILLGTCGAFSGSGLSIGDAVIVERSLLGSSGAASGLAYIPPLAAAPSEAEPALVHSLAEHTGLRQVSAVTVAAITSGGAAADTLSRTTGCEVEHMEAHPFLLAAARARIPAACLLGVANEVGPRGHEEWKENADRASAKAIAALRNFLACVSSA